MRSRAFWFVLGAVWYVCSSNWWRSNDKYWEYNHGGFGTGRLKKGVK